MAELLANPLLYRAVQRLKADWPSGVNHWSFVCYRLVKRPRAFMYRYDLHRVMAVYDSLVSPLEDWLGYRQSKYLSERYL